jgi:CRP-like cAMP-binding protein
MAIDALVKPLLSLPLFHGLPVSQVTEIVRRSERTIYTPGDVIAAENQLSDAAIVIVSGTCTRIDDDLHHRNGEIIPEGSMISELAMVVEVVHASTIIARDRVKALRMTRERMRELMEEEPSLAEHFSMHIFDRLQRLAQDLSAVDAVLKKAATLSSASAISHTHGVQDRVLH